MNRSDRVLDYFTTHFTEIGATPRALSLQEWSELEDQGMRIHQGFRRPTPDNGGVALFCPDLIAEQTEHLSDEGLQGYLETMQWIVDFETTLYMLDLEEASQRAEDALADRAPGSLRLMTEVQMAWLDKSHG